jgi:hypothetical protein
MVQRAVAPDLEKIRDQEMEFKTKMKSSAFSLPLVLLPNYLSDFTKCFPMLSIPWKFKFLMYRVRKGCIDR